MKKLTSIYSLALILTVLGLSGCGNKTTDGEDKKLTLLEKEKELRQLKVEIAELKKEIGADSTSSVTLASLVATIQPKKALFTQFIEVPGTADSRQNILVSSEATGTVIQLYVQEGSTVNKGQIIARVDAESMRRQVDELKTRLQFAKEIFEKQERLWEKKIGSELEYLQSKNNKETLEQSIRTLESQVAKSNITAPISGYLDKLFLREGQTVAMGAPAMRIVNLSKIIVQADVSEKYVTAIQRKDSAYIFFESIGETIATQIKTVSQVVNADNRTFTVEMELDNKKGLIKPNVLAKVKLATYQNPQALIIPTHIIQQDKENDFVYVVINEGGNLQAKKQVVSKGMSYKGQTEILKGLDGSEQVVSVGGRGLSEGEPLRIK